VALAVAAVLSAAMVAPSPAAAHRLTVRDWSQGHAVGNDCVGGGELTGNYVLAAQANVWADHAFPDMGHRWVDGYYGPYTDRAFYNYKRYHLNITSSQCVGYNTWYEMMDRHRYHVGNDLISERYHFKTRYAEIIGWNYVLCPNAWLVIWFDGNHVVDHGDPPLGPCVVGP
jgi:hypothetical protein